MKNFGPVVQLQGKSTLGGGGVRGTRPDPGSVGALRTTVKASPVHNTVSCEKCTWTIAFASLLSLQSGSLALFMGWDVPVFFEISAESCFVGYFMGCTFGALFRHTG